MHPVLITHNGETHSMREWSKITGIHWNTIKYRYVTKNMSIDSVFSESSLKGKNKSLYPYKQIKVNGKIKLAHRLIAEKALGHELPAKSQVHHIDSNPLNNSNDNLVVCPNAAYHKLLHRRHRAFDDCGNADYRNCCICGEYSDPSDIYITPNGRQCFHSGCLNLTRKLQRLAKKIGYDWSQHTGKRS